MLKLITAPLEIEIGPNDVRKLPPGLRLEAPVRRLVVIDREPPVTGTEVVGTVITVTDIIAWDIDTVEAFVPIDVDIEFSPLHCGDPSRIKHFQEIVYHHLALCSFQRVEIPL